jgi:DNA-binding MarR family transcriptional regulator
MREDREQLRDEIIDGQRAILQATHAASTPSWLELQLTMAQLKALFLLAQGTRSMSEVGEGLGTGRPAASLLIDRLVHEGLVERSDDPTNRRRTIVRLTEEGETSVRQLREGGRERYRDALDQLSDEDLIALRQGMRALTVAIGASASRQSRIQSG